MGYDATINLYFMNMSIIFSKLFLIIGGNEIGSVQFLYLIKSERQSIQHQ